MWGVEVWSLGFVVLDLGFEVHNLGSGIRLTGWGSHVVKLKTSARPASSVGSETFSTPKDVAFSTPHLASSSTPSHEVL